MIFRILSSVLFLTFGFLFLKFPFPIHYVEYHPSSEPNKVVPTLIPNTFLQNITKIAKGKLFAPESILIDEEKNILYAAVDSWILQIDLKTEQVSKFVSLERPLGIIFDQNKNIIVADAISGLLKVSKDKTITILTNTDETGKHLTFTDDLDISKETGDIYFSDASEIRPWWTGSSWDLKKSSNIDVATGYKTGKLLVYSPKDKTTKVLLDQISFANGIALSKDESFVLVCETGRERILKHYLKGEKKGKTEVLLYLPGYPDNIRRSTDGSNTFWIAIFGPTHTILNMIHPFPIIKRIILMLPDWLEPNLEKFGLVIQIDENGNVLQSLSDPNGKEISFITNVVQSKNKLYFGSLRQDFVGVFEQK